MQPAKMTSAAMMPAMEPPLMLTEAEVKSREEGKIDKERAESAKSIRYTQKKMRCAFAYPDDSDPLELARAAEADGAELETLEEDRARTLLALAVTVTIFLDVGVSSGVELVAVEA